MRIDQVMAVADRRERNERWEDPVPTRGVEVVTTVPQALHMLRMRGIHIEGETAEEVVANRVLDSFWSGGLWAEDGVLFYVSGSQNTSATISFESNTAVWWHAEYLWDNIPTPTDIILDLLERCR